MHVVDLIMNSFSLKLDISFKHMCILSVLLVSIISRFCVLFREHGKEGIFRADIRHESGDTSISVEAIISQHVKSVTD